MPEKRSETFSHYWKNRLSFPLWVGYSITFLLVCMVTGFLLLLHPYFPLYRFPILYVLIIMLAAYTFGDGPAVMAFILGGLLYHYYFLPPIGSLWPLAETVSEWAAMAAFLIGTLIVGFAMALLRRSRRHCDILMKNLEDHEEQKLEFYRRTIMAATNDKLVVTETYDIATIIGQPIETWTIYNPKDLSKLRHRIAEISAVYGMDESRKEKFIMCVGEASTNALKHAGGGVATLHFLKESLIFVISDRGQGIGALNLPDVALRERYSTIGTLGMGYKVMISFGDRVYLATGSDGTTIAIEMKLHGSCDQSMLPDLLGSTIEGLCDCV